VSLEIKFATNLKCNEKFIKAFQMLQSKVTFEKIKQSVVSDANEDAKLNENHINNFFAQMARCNYNIELYLGITIVVFENA